MESLSDLEVITFDCYGTLIDWETGIRASVKQALENLGLTQSEEAKIFDLYEEEEKKIEVKSYQPYRRVQAEALRRASRRIGKKIPDQSIEILAEQLPNWLPFPDTNPALQRLAARYKLGILSNVDNDLLAGTLRNLVVTFDFLITAERVRSYKPAQKHWLEARKVIGDRGWIHVAGSLYHDIVPASELGIKSVWVNRKHSREHGEYQRRILKEVDSLTRLADWLAP